MNHPQICDQCLGDNDDIRMIKVPQSAECKLCTLTFDLYHFKKDNRSNTIIKTIICSDCAKQRNVCQCCMLDMRWHITVQERDHLISLIKGYNIVTREATNDMMKRFLVIKNKGKRMGGANVTNDKEQLSLVMGQMEDLLKREAVRGDHNVGAKRVKSDASSEDKLANVHVHHLLDKLPLNETFDLVSLLSKSHRLFLYNIDLSIAEWKFEDVISQILDMEVSQWKDPHPLAIMINHRASCGSINFKTAEIFQRFIQKVISKGDTISITKKINNKDQILQRGILQIDHFNIYLVPWIKDNFTQNSFGNNNKEYLKLSNELRKIIIQETTTTTTTSNKKQNISKGRISKKNKNKNKKNGRVTSSFEL